MGKKSFDLPAAVAYYGGFLEGGGGVQYLNEYASYTKIKILNYKIIENTNI